MSSFASASANLLRRLIHRRHEQQSSDESTDRQPAEYGRTGPVSGDLSRAELDSLKPTPGHPAALDGMSAVAYLDACICTDGALGSSFPASAGARAFAKQQSLRSDTNAFDRLLQHTKTLDPRGTLSTALGLSLSGQRASCYVSGTDLMAGGLETLAAAAGRSAPMVVYVACRAASGHASAIGTGHESWHAAAAASNCIQLFARNVQEAADFAIIGRRVAEQALCPVIIGMDGEQTAVALQDLKLADDRLVLHRYIGQPADHITPPTVAQQMLFGDQRRRIPRWFDLERPMMLGSLQDRDVWALGAAARRVYVEQKCESILHDAFATFERFTGRAYHPLLTHRLREASMVLVAQGSLVDTACALSDWLLRTRNLKVGVIGIRTLRPFPGKEIAQQLSGIPTVLVLERVANTLADDDLPLTREVRTAIQKHGTNAASRARQTIGSIACGCGGRPVRAADLFTMVELADTDPTFFAGAIHDLGLDFIRKQSTYPKRQALHDALRRRNDADVSSIGIRARPNAKTDDPAASKAVDLRPNGTFTLAVCRPAGTLYEPIAGEAGALLHDLMHPMTIRSRPGLSWQRFDQFCVDTVSLLPDKQERGKTSGTAGILDPGDDSPVDCAVIVHPAGSGAPFDSPQLTNRLVHGATVVLVTDSDTAATPTLSARTAEALLHRNVTIYRAVVSSGTGCSHAAAVVDTALAALIKALAATETFKSRLSPDKAQNARTEALNHDVTDASVVEARAAVFSAALASTAVAGIADLAAETDKSATSDAGGQTMPAILASLSRPDAGVECVARFHGQTGQPLMRGDIDELTADPYLASGTVPPLTAMFRDVSAARTTLLEFDPATCDGNGKLWTSCPDGSVLPIVASARSLIDTGIRLAGEAGDTAATTLASIAGKLATRISRIVKTATVTDPAPTELGRLLTVAFDQVTEGADPEDDRQKQLTAALDSVISQIGALAVCRTPVFFDEAEKIASGSGELFSLIINPDACKCPELVAQRCNERGLRVIPQTPEALGNARKLWDLWQKLPDTAGSTITRVTESASVGPLAAILLSRHCQFAMAAGDGAEPASGSKLALRYVLALCEYHLQPRLQEQLHTIDQLRSSLAGRIRSHLADALPISDLDALAGGLESLARDEFSVAELASRIDGAVHAGSVDGAALNRLVEAARGLADLEWRIGTGPDGLGRARVGLTIAPGPTAQATGAFPFNPFACPVLIGFGADSCHVARGLLEGQIDQTLAGIRLMRWAAMLTGDGASPLPKAAAARKNAMRDLTHLTYEQLTDKEKPLCPPMIVVGNGSGLGTSELSQIVWALESGRPIKVFILSDLGGKADTAGLAVDAMCPYPMAQRDDLAFLALLSRETFVSQASIANPTHLAHSILAALDHDGPALVHIHAPSPERHGFNPADLFTQAALAVDSRAFPLFTYDPAAGSGVFGSRLDITANPGSHDTWVQSPDGHALTPVHWAVTESRFVDHFRRLDPATDPAPTAADDYLLLAPDKTAACTAHVPFGGERLAVSAALMADARRQLRFWQTLQELAGFVTPFTEQVRRDIEQETAQMHEKELADLRREYEQKLADVKASFEADAAQRVTGRLLQMAGYGGPSGSDNNGQGGHPS